jgi:hypothetical protein
MLSSIIGKRAKFSLDPQQLNDDGKLRQADLSLIQWPLAYSIGHVSRDITRLTIKTALSFEQKPDID